MQYPEFHETGSLFIENFELGYIRAYRIHWVMIRIVPVIVYLDDSNGIIVLLCLVYKRIEYLNHDLSSPW
jgi:hypothetical protein